MQNVLITCILLFYYKTYRHEFQVLPLFLQGTNKLSGFVANKPSGYYDSKKEGFHDLSTHTTGDTDNRHKNLNCDHDTTRNILS